MNSRIVMGLALGVCLLSVSACNKANEFPSNMHGRYDQQRLFGANAVVVLDKNSLKMEGCTINCPVLNFPFTTISCDSMADTKCTVSNADCTGTIEYSSAFGGSIDVSLTAVPGAEGEAATARQVNCFQYSANMSHHQ